MSAPSIEHERTRSPCSLSLFLSFFSFFSFPFLSFPFFSFLSFFPFLSFPFFLSLFLSFSLSRLGARPRGGQGLDTEPSHRVYRIQEDKAWTQSPATELTEFRGAAKRRTRTELTEFRARPRGGQGLDTEPSHRVYRIQEDKAWTQSPATELTEFRGAAKRRTRTELTEFRARPRGGHGPATEPSHRVDRGQGRGQEGPATEPSHRVDRVQGRGQDEDKRRTRPGHRAQPQS